MVIVWRSILDYSRLFAGIPKIEEESMTPKTQSTCKQCGGSKEIEGGTMPGNVVCLYCSVSEPASTGEQPPKQDHCFTCGSFDPATKLSVHAHMIGYKIPGWQNVSDVCDDPYHLAAHPSEPSAPHAENCICIPCLDKSVEKDLKNIAAPQTSGEPAELSDRAKVALYPEMRDELNLLRSENSSLRAYRLNTEFDAQLSAPQPVSGDAPKVEEIARQIVRKFADKYGNVGVSHQDIDMVSAILRPYFPPASQTPPHCPKCHIAALESVWEGSGEHKQFKVFCACGFYNYISSHDQFAQFFAATPASTARKSSDSHLGAVRD